MQNYEKLGAFYLGREYDLGADALGTESVLYDSKDLTTHAVIIGMTGSGKTGLGIGMIEEAALDKIPVIAIDPKGDLGNLLLTFPKLAAEDFEPWVDAQQAVTKGQTTTEFAKDQADMWKKGLASWGQDGERIQRLKDAAEFAIFTPGSTAGIAVSVLSNFTAPDAALRDDAEAFAERIQATATSILTLLGIDADPLTSREHILISNILQHSWQADQSLDIAGLIGAIQNPPITKIGVMDLESIYPAKDRFALAMQLNNVLASPSFSAWMQGVPLSARSLLYTDAGKPRVSIMSIAHLNDSERMFFVTMLLNEVIAWMRAQPGTASLRAILYMDELFGYMPPTANPPSKKLFLTLLKQARAYGLGLVLSTQNPVDLDYKGLSNTGTWFIGRLQTERDKGRVLEGLEGAAAGGAPFDKNTMEQTLAGLGKRVFLLHNVHESKPVVFHTRWAMSYLPGPLTRDQIKTLTENVTPPLPTPQAAYPAPKSAPTAATQQKPALAPGIKQYYLAPIGDSEAVITYYPQVLGAADVVYSNKTNHVESQRQFMLGVEVNDGPVPLDWDAAESLNIAIGDLQQKPLPDAGHTEPAAAARNVKNYKSWESDYKKWLRNEQALTLYKCKAFKAISQVGESEADFRIRLQQMAKEQRDLEVAKLRERFEKKAAGLHDKLRDAEQDIAKEKAQATQKKMESALSIGGALLGAFLGRKKISSSTFNKFGTAARRTGYAAKEARDVAEAEADAAQLRAKIEAEAKDFETEISNLQSGIDTQTQNLEEVTVRAKSSDINVLFLALLWLPYRQADDGRSIAAYL